MADKSRAARAAFFIGMAAITLAGCGLTPSPTPTSRLPVVGCAPLADYMPAPASNTTLSPEMQGLMQRIVDRAAGAAEGQPTTRVRSSGSWLVDWMATCESPILPVPQDDSFIADVCSFQNQMSTLQNATESGLQYLVSLADESPSRSDLIKAAILGATYAGCQYMFGSTP